MSKKTTTPTSDIPPAPVTKTSAPAAPIIPTDLLDTLSAAKLLQCDRATITRWIFTGKLPAFRVGGRWRISRADVLSMIERYKPQDVPMPRTRAEVEAEAAHVDAVLRSVGIRK